MPCWFYTIHFFAVAKTATFPQCSSRALFGKKMVTICTFVICFDVYDDNILINLQNIGMAYTFTSAVQKMTNNLFRLSITIMVECFCMENSKDERCTSLVYSNIVSLLVRSYLHFSKYGDFITKCTWTRKKLASKREKKFTNKCKESAHATIYPINYAFTFETYEHKSPLAWLIFCAVKMNARFNFKMEELKG